MGKLFNSFVISTFVVVTLALVDGSALTLTPIANLFFNPTSNLGEVFYSLLTNAITAIGLTAFIIGTFVIKLDWLVRAGLFTTFASYTMLPLIDLWHSLASKITSLPSGVCEGTAGICSQLGTTGINTFGALIAGLIIGPLILYALYSCLEYVWGGDR